MVSSESSSVDIKKTSEYQRIYISKFEYDPDEELIDRFAVNSNFYSK